MRFGGIVALNGVSFTVDRRQICGLIGPNGSGKTTLFNCISGIYRNSRGSIDFDGTTLSGLPRHRMAGLGIGRTFQNVALFGSMSVRDNMLVGAHHLGRSGFVANALRLPAPSREEARARAHHGPPARPAGPPRRRRPPRPPACPSAPASASSSPAR